MNPLLLWWRWWSRVIDPNHDEALVKAEEVIGEQRANADRLSSELEAKDAEIAALQKRLSQSDSKVQDLQVRLDQAERAPAAGEPARPPDVSTATEVLGRQIKLDDLTVIEGIGPKIADLLSNAGFSTWHALSEADTTELRDVLQQAGPRYRIHDPSKWPPQAALLARGQWQEYKDFASRETSRPAKHAQEPSAQETRAGASGKPRPA